MSKINIGFIGLGRIADVHAPAYFNNPDACIYAVCDSNAEIAKRMMEKWGAKKMYPDYRELLNDKDIHAVEILLPQKLHEISCIDAAKAGKHIAMQKPMSVSLESADRMINAAKDSGIILKVTDNYCFYPPFIFAKKLLENDEIGEPVNIRISFVSGKGGWPIPASTWEWRVAENAEGRGFQTFDHGHHLWATSWFFMGEVERVKSWIDAADGILDCPSVMMWKYKNSSRYGTCEFVHAPDLEIPSDYYANDEWLQITGTKGIIFINRCTGLIHKGPVVSVFNNHGWKHFDDINSDWGEGFKGAAVNFIDSIRGKAAPLLSAEQGREILKFDLAMARSSRLRREVYLDEMDNPRPEKYTERRVAAEKREKNPPKTLLSRIFGEGYEKYAEQASSLTRQLAENYKEEAVKEWNSCIAIHLTPEGRATELKYTLTIGDGKVTIIEGILPENPVLTIKTGCGTWAAILLKKKKIEMAFIQGKIKLEGKAEEGLKLRAAFGI